MTALKNVRSVVTAIDAILQANVPRKKWTANLFMVFTLSRLFLILLIFKNNVNGVRALNKPNYLYN